MDRIETNCVWTNEEVELLKNNYENMTNGELFEMMNGRHDKISITKKSGRLGLKKNKETIERAKKIGGNKKIGWTQEETDILIDKFPLMNTKELFKLYDGKFTITSINVKAEKLGLHKDDETINCNHENQFRKIPLNKDYFKKQSCNMAYILGFLSADGCLICNAENNTKKVTMSLQSDDGYILERMSYEMGMDGMGINDKFNVTNGKRFKQRSLVISNSNIYDQLIDLGLTPKKSLTLRYCWKLDEKYLPDYIRGVFDGDGCLYTANNGRSKFFITTGSYGFVEDLLKIFKLWGIDARTSEEQRDVPNKRDGKRNFKYRVLIGNGSDLIKLHDILYENAGDFCLTRKKEKFQKCVDYYNRNIDQKWTEEDITILRENYAIKSNYELMDVFDNRFGRGVIAGKARQEGLVKDKETMHRTLSENSRWRKVDNKE